MAVVTLLATAASILAVASPAQAVPCVSPSHGVNGEGAGYINVYSATFRPAPYAECGASSYAPSGTRVYYHCYVYNSYGNKWWWVRVAESSQSGWVYDGNILDIRFDDNGDGWVSERGC
ncbi:hypothetical protein ACI2K4_35460 [Micromonospora sp. NPDC050397]|uniref:hypothetical protein n=1 Tax=Micromonospora sp. NPDC050397 TaxID=3364279 RepID=UPI00384FF043